MIDVEPVKVIGAEWEVFLVIEIAQGRLRPRPEALNIALTHLAPQPLPAALKIAGTQRSPRRQVLGRRKLIHVQSDR